MLNKVIIAACIGFIGSALIMLKAWDLTGIFLLLIVSIFYEWIS